MYRNCWNISKLVSSLQMPQKFLDVSLKFWSGINVEISQKIVLFNMGQIVSKAASIKSVEIFWITFSVYGVSIRKVGARSSKGLQDRSRSPLLPKWQNYIFSLKNYVGVGKFAKVMSRKNSRWLRLGKKNFHF